MLKLHTGRFGSINLQPYYSVILGLLTIALIVSGVSLLLLNEEVKEVLSGEEGLSWVLLALCMRVIRRRKFYQRQRKFLRLV